MRPGIDFWVEGLPKAYSHGRKRKLKPLTAKSNVMETPRQYKTSPELRKYWRLHKQKQRAEKAKK